MAKKDKKGGYWTTLLGTIVGIRVGRMVNLGQGIDGIAKLIGPVWIKGGPFARGFGVGVGIVGAAQLFPQLVTGDAASARALAPSASSGNILGGLLGGGTTGGTTGGTSGGTSNTSGADENAESF